MIFKREPALILGAIQAIITLAVSFGLQLSAEQTGAIMARGSHGDPKPDEGGRI